MAMNIHKDQTVGQPISTDTGRGDSPNNRIQSFVEQSTLMLFVKGVPSQPMCGFSATVMDIFNRIGAPYATFNILEDPEIRAGAKSFSQWPTFPQVYVGGEFIGGCDIAVEMFQSGELQETVKSAVEAKGPGPFHSGDMADSGAGAAGDTLPVPASAKATGDGAAEVKQIRPRKANLMGLNSFVVIDVRNPEELSFAKLDNTHLLPLGQLEARYKEIPKDAKLLMLCRSGGRSNRAGEFLVSKGYRHVWNLDGGINGWSDEVDSTLTKY